MRSLPCWQRRGAWRHRLLDPAKAERNDHRHHAISPGISQLRRVRAGRRDRAPAPRTGPPRPSRSRRSGTVARARRRHTSPGLPGRAACPRPDRGGLPGSRAERRATATAARATARRRQSWRRSRPSPRRHLPRRAGRSAAAPSHCRAGRSAGRRTGSETGRAIGSTCPKCGWLPASNRGAWRRSSGGRHSAARTG